MNTVTQIICLLSMIERKIFGTIVDSKIYPNYDTELVDTEVIEIIKIKIEIIKRREQFVRKIERGVVYNLETI